MSNWDRPYNFNNWTEVVLCKVKGNKFHFQGLCEGKRKVNNSFNKIADDTMIDEEYDMYGGHLATVYNFVHKSQVGNCSSFYKGLPSSGTDHVCYPWLPIVVTWNKVCCLLLQ